MFALAVVVITYVLCVMKMSMNVYWSLWRNNPQTKKNVWNGRKIKDSQVSPDANSYTPTVGDVPIMRNLQ